MHYNTEPCIIAGCKHRGRCKVLWGDACKVLGGNKIPRMGAIPYHTWHRAEKEDRVEQEEQARQQAVRDQLRAAREANEVKRRPMWMERAAGME